MKPLHFADVLDKCGEPGENLVKRPLPFTMYLMGDKRQPVKTFYGHRRIADEVVKVFQEILDYYGIEFIRENGLDNYGGCFANRKARGAFRMSVHAWGMAVDYLPQLGQFGKPPMTPEPVVRIFKDHGFLWGGDWEQPDGMHFSAVEEI